MDNLFKKDIESLCDLLEVGEIIKFTSKKKAVGSDGRIMCTYSICVDCHKSNDVLWLKVDYKKYEKEIVAIAKKYDGIDSMVIYDTTTELKYRTDYKIDICDMAIDELKNLIGENNVVIK